MRVGGAGSWCCVPFAEASPEEGYGGGALWAKGLRVCSPLSHPALCEEDSVGFPENRRGRRRERVDRSA